MALSSLSLGGHKIHFRDNCSDSTIVNVNFLSGRREYEFPKEPPRIILDIGANIGVVSVLMARQYPAAVIHAFEPQADNFKILELNTKPYQNIHRHRYALGKSTGRGKLFPSANPTNFGGYSLMERGCDATRSEQVEVLEVNEALKWLGIEAVDLIKIDCEGAEYDILMSMEKLAKTGWICGELHGNSDWELLGFLSRGFDLAIRKGLEETCFHFTARKRL